MRSRPFAASTVDMRAPICACEFAHHHELLDKRDLGAFDPQHINPVLIAAEHHAGGVVIGLARFHGGIDGYDEFVVVTTRLVISLHIAQS